MCVIASPPLQTNSSVVHSHAQGDIRSDDRNQNPSRGRIMAGSRPSQEPPPGPHPGLLHPGLLHPGLLHPGLLHPGLLRPGLLRPGRCHAGLPLQTHHIKLPQVHGCCQMTGHGSSSTGGGFQAALISSRYCHDTIMIATRKRIRTAVRRQR